MRYAKVQEETLKNKVARDFFGKFDCTEIIEKLDFTVKSKKYHYFLWAEAKADREFRNDCLVYTLFHGSNTIQSQCGVNHWIPFTEEEVNARSKFKSNFMTDFIAGKIEYAHDLFTNGKKRKKLVFSAEAKAVFMAGKKLWTYYHKQPKCNVNASLYDIREHFQGRNAQGKMNNKSTDETYNGLVADLRSALKTLAAKIEPKVYAYGVLRK